MAAVAVGSVVQTPYGNGKVLSHREENDLYQIELANWVLSDNQKVYVYSQPGQFKVETVAEAEPVAKELAVGVQVKSAYGVGKIIAIRAEDEMYQVEVTNWVLSDGQRVFIFCQASQLTIVDSDAAVAAEADNVAVEAEADAPKAVKTAYGQGIVVDFREEDNMFKIEVSNWTLSNGQKVYIYCQQSQFTLIEEEDAADAVVSVPANVKAGKGDTKGCCTIM